MACRPIITLELLHCLIKAIRRNNKRENAVTAKSDLENLVNVKLALSRKYTSLANQTKSKPKKRQFSQQAVKFKRQAENLQRNG